MQLPEASKFGTHALLEDTDCDGSSGLDHEIRLINFSSDHVAGSKAVPRGSSKNASNPFVAQSEERVLALTQTRGDSRVVGKARGGQP